MPMTFRDREQAFEAKFAHDEEFRFLVLARRDKLFGRWAADKLQLGNEAAEAVVREVLAVPNGPRHDLALLQHIAETFASREAIVSEQDLSGALAECGRQALRQLVETPADPVDPI